MSDPARGAQVVRPLFPLPSTLPGGGTLGTTAVSITAAALRGQRPEEVGLSFLDPARAQAGLTMHGQMHLGMFRASPFDIWAVPPHKHVLAKAEQLAAILHGSLTVGNDTLLGLDEHLLQIRELCSAVDTQLEAAANATDTAARATELRKLEGHKHQLAFAIRRLREQLAGLYRATEAIALANAQGISPVIQKIAESIAEEITTLGERLQALSQSDASETAFAEALGHYEWSHTIASMTYERHRYNAATEANESEIVPLRYRASPFLARAGAMLLEALHAHGRLVRAEPGAGAVFEFDDADCLAKTLGRMTSTEFDALLHLLGWSVSSAHVTTAVPNGKVVRETMVQPNGKPTKEWIEVPLYDTVTTPAIRVVVDFTQAIVGSVRRTAEDPRAVIDARPIPEPTLLSDAELVVARAGIETADTASDS